MEFTLLAAAGGVIFAPVATWLMWIWRSRRAERQMTSTVNISRDYPWLAQPSRSKPWTARSLGSAPAKFSPPALSFLDSKALTPEKLALVDGLMAAYINWRWTENGASLVAEFVSRIPDRLLSAESLFAHGMERLAEVSQSTERFIAEAIPVELAHWFNDSGIGELIHALQQKVEILDAGGTINFRIDDASSSFDIGAKFPWVTAVLSSAKEIRLLLRRDTTLQRALGHVAMDIFAVSMGGYLASGVAGLIITGVAAILDVTVSYGLMSAICGLFGVGGAVAGAKAAKHLKFERLENLAQQYSRMAASVSKEIPSITEDATKHLSELHGAFEMRGRLLVEEMEREWQATAARFGSEEENLLHSFCSHTKDNLGIWLNSAERRLDRLEEECGRRWFYFWLPTSGNVRLWVERRLLRQTLQSLRNAIAEVESLPTNDPSGMWVALAKATALDPMSTPAKFMADFAQQCGQLKDRFMKIQTRLEKSSKMAFDALEQQRKLGEQAIIHAANIRLGKILTPFRALETDLQIEAAALGARVSR